MREGNRLLTWSEASGDRTPAVRKRCGCSSSSSTNELSPRGYSIYFKTPFLYTFLFPQDEVFPVPIPALLLLILPLFLLPVHLYRSRLPLPERSRGRQERTLQSQQPRVQGSDQVLRKHNLLLLELVLGVLILLYTTYPSY